MTATTLAPADFAVDCESRRSGRLLDIDRAKGLTIILVVIGHIAARDKPIGNEWYVLLQFLINSFHMPFFMYLAGYVFFYSGNATNPRPTYYDYVITRAERLLIPFFSIGLLIVICKFASRNLLQVDNLTESWKMAVRALVWDTGNSPAESIWFIVVLFVYCAAVPPLLTLARNRLWPLIMMAAIAYFLAAYMLVVPSYVYLDRIATYLVFFLLGGLAQRTESTQMLLDRGFVVLLGCFAMALVLLALHIFEDQAFVLCNFLGIPVLHSLVRKIPNDQILLSIGKYAFVIYLLNSIFIGLSKGVLLKFTSWNGPNFFGFAVILGLLGLFGPILTKQLLFRKLPAIDRATD